MINYVIGIDPGMKGSAVILTRDKQVEIYSTGELYGESGLSVFRRRILELNPLSIQVFVEHVHSFPGQGVVSTATFMKNYGMILGILLGSGWTDVQPQTWQLALGLGGYDNKTERMNVYKTFAGLLHPDITVTHKNAAALCISEYARRKLML